MVPDGPAALLRACERILRRSSEGMAIKLGSVPGSNALELSAGTMAKVEDEETDMSCNVLMNV